MDNIQINVVINHKTTKLNVPKNIKLLDILQQFNISAICGGKGTCGKCKVIVKKGFINISKSDEQFFTLAELNQGCRLACTAYPDQDITIEVSSKQETKLSSVISFTQTNNENDSISITKINLNRIRDSFTYQILPENQNNVSFDVVRQCSLLIDNNIQEAYAAYEDHRLIRVSQNPINLYGIGIDIGTTTVGMALVNLENGEIIDKHSEINSQRQYGADVVTRIEKSRSGELNLFYKAITDQISNGIKLICDKNCIPYENLYKVAIAGNTTMIHLLLGLSCKTIGINPFTPITTELVSFNYSQVFTGSFNCTVDILPSLSAYVGADVTSGIFLTEMQTSKSPTFLLDIGTNGEMAVNIDGKIICTSTAAGPAFEGGNIKCGTGSIPGAISQVEYSDSEFKLTTIDDQSPVGICGSGVIDIVSKCLSNNIIQTSGRFNKEFGSKQIDLWRNPDNTKIFFDQKDVRELQLGKSALRSGIDTLLNVANLSYNDIETIYIAGGFGFKINFDNAVEIGLIPYDLRNKIKLIGNSSLGGTIKYMLNSKSKDILNSITKNSSEFSLSENKMFNKLFIDNMSLKKY